LASKTNALYTMGHPLLFPVGTPISEIVMRKQNKTPPSPKQFIWDSEANRAFVEMDGKRLTVAQYRKRFGLAVPGNIPGLWLTIQGNLQRFLYPTVRVVTTAPEAKVEVTWFGTRQEQKFRIKATDRPTDITVSAEKAFEKCLGKIFREVSKW
jgi:hypothetical protein